MRHHPLLVSLLLPLVLPAQEAKEPARLREPFLRVRVEDWAALAGNRVIAKSWQAMTEAMAGVPGGKDTTATWEVAWSALKAPFELSVILDADERLVLGAVLPASEGAITDHLRAIASVPVGTTGTCRVGDAQWTATPWGGGLLAEGDRDGRRVVLFDSAPRGEPAALVDGFFAAVQRESPGTRRLRRAAPSGTLTALLNVEQLLAAMPQAAAGSLGIVKTLLGARFAGLAVGVQATPDRLGIETHLDLLPGQGMLATLLPREAAASRLTGWLPPDLREFVSLRLSMDGLVALARFAAGFGLVSFDPADWGEGFESLRGTNVLALLEEHLTGELQMLTEPTKVEDALDADAAVPGVFMLGTPDGARCFAALRGLLDALELGVGFAEDAGLGEGVHTLSMEGEPQCRIAVHPQFLAFAPADATSTAILRATLATRGEGKLPAAWQQRLPVAADDAVPLALGLGHVLSNVQSRLMVGEMTGRARPEVPDTLLRALVAGLGRHFAGDAGFQAMRVDAGAYGVRVRIVW